MTATNTNTLQHETNPRRVLILLVFFTFLASLGYQMLFWTLDYFPADEGLMIQVSTRILKGDVLYRDIFLPYTPLAWYVEAAAFKLLGPNLMIARLLSTVLFSVTCGIILLWSSEMMSRSRALLCTAVFILYRIWVFPFWQYFGYSILSIFFALVGGYFFILFLRESQSRLWLLLAGICAGLCFWAKPNVGVQTGSAMFITLVLASLSKKHNRDEHGLSNGKRLLWHSLLILLGALIITIPILCHLIVNDTLCEMITQMATLKQLYFESERYIAFPRLLPLVTIDESFRENSFYFTPGIMNQLSLFVKKHFSYDMRETAWLGAGIKMLYYLPILALIAGLFSSMRLLRNVPGSSNTTIFSFTFLASLFIFLQVFFFPPVIYLLIAFPPLIILSFAMFDGVIKKHFLPRRRRLRSMIAILAVSGLVIYFLLSLAGTASRVYIERTTVRTKRGILRIHGWRGGVFRDIYSYIDKETRPGDTIFVLPHNPLVYFFTERTNPTPYDNLQPDTPGRQAEGEIIAALEKDKTQTLIFDQEEFPKKAKLPKAYPDIYTYMVENYYPVLDKEGLLTIYRRKENGKED